MAIARQSFTVGSNSVNSVATVTLTGVQTGESIVILQLWNGAATSTSVTCTSGGSETVSAVGSESLWSAYTMKTRWHVVDNIGSTASKTFTSQLSGAPTDTHKLYAWRVSGALTSGIYDDAQSASSTSGNATTSVTTSQSGDAIFALSGNNNGVPTAGSGYTAESGATGMFYSEAEYDIDVGASGSKTVDMVRAGATQWHIVAIAIKSADGAGGTIALSGSAITGSIGTSAPGIQIPL